MSLLTDAQALVKRPGGTCGVALLVRRLSESEQTELDEAIWTRDDDGEFLVTAKAVADALKGRDIILNYQTISRHRAGSCACR